MKVAVAATEKDRRGPETGWKKHREAAVEMGGSLGHSCEDERREGGRWWWTAAVVERREMSWDSSGGIEIMFL